MGHLQGIAVFSNEVAAPISGAIDGNNAVPLAKGWAQVSKGVNFNCAHGLILRNNWPTIKF
jgi:hypothetical protein